MIPVELISGEVATTHIDLDMLDARDHSRIRYKRVNEKTGKEVPWNQIVKGYEYQEGKYAILSPADFKRAAADVVRGAQIIDFVDADSISPIYFEKPYFLQPQKGGEKAYALLRDVLRKTKRAGIAHLVIQTKQHLAALLPHGDLLALITLRWDEEIRDPEEIKAPHGRTSNVSPRELAMAEQLVNGMYSEWDPTQYQDEYTHALKKYIAAKSKPGHKELEAPEPEEEEVSGPYNIMELLKKSVAHQSESKPGKHRNTHGGTHGRKGHSRRAS
jgi:DNA end-binding protein Ku